MFNRMVVRLNGEELGQRIRHVDIRHSDLLGERLPVLVRDGQREKWPVGVDAGVGEGHPKVARCGPNGAFDLGFAKPVGRRLGAGNASRHPKVTSSVHAKAGGVDAQATQIRSQRAKGTTHGHDASRA